LIVLLCLTLLTLALVSLYGYSHNAAESIDETASTRGNANPRARSSDGPCTFLTDEDAFYIIKCSDIPDDTGEVVANYINENSNSVSTVIGYSYFLHLFTRKKVKELNATSVIVKSVCEITNMAS
jgi:hypothetical protein